MNGKENGDSPSIGKSPLISFGWETWIRTTIHGVRVIPERSGRLSPCIFLCFHMQTSGIFDKRKCLIEFTKIFLHTSQTLHSEQNEKGNENGNCPCEKSERCEKTL